MSKNEMPTVPLTPAQRGFVKRVAEAESTSEAAVVRRLDDFRDADAVQRPTMKFVAGWMCALHQRRRHALAGELQRRRLA